LKHNNPYSEIVLASKLNVVNQFFLKNCENCIKKMNESYKLFFQGDT